MCSPRCKPFYAAISAIERLAAASYPARIERQPSRRIDKNLARSGVGAGLGTELSAKFPKFLMGWTAPLPGIDVPQRGRL
jgi:hypothetical protein